jgi:hypothetical protein
VRRGEDKTQRVSGKVKPRTLRNEAVKKPAK